jgi:hypothetical protein
LPWIINALILQYPQFPPGIVNASFLIKVVDVTRKGERIMKEKKITENALYSAILIATLIALLMLVISLPVYASTISGVKSLLSTAVLSVKI